jgi:subtilisin-like proprotein convertase family protein
MNTTTSARKVQLFTFKTIVFFVTIVLLKMNVFAQTSDMSVVLTPPVSPICGNTATFFSVNVSNAGPDAAVNYILSVKLDGVDLPGSPQVIASMASGANQNYIYGSVFPSPGKHKIMATISPGTPADPNWSNDTSRQTVTVLFKGTYTVGPGASDNFSSIKMAVDTLNLYGICGSTTVQVAAGHVETNANIALTATGNALYSISFVAAGTPHPVIQSNAAGSGTIGTGTVGNNGDAFIKINGGDYITFNGIDVVEQYTGSTATLRMEYGYMINRASTTDGAKNVTIKNCSITLDHKCPFSVGIYQTNLNSGGATTNPSAITGIHESNKYNSNNITNVYSGFRFTGYNDVSPFSLYDQNIEVGVGGGNTITNYGGGSTTAYGLYCIYQNGMKIANDSINGGDTTSATLYGIYASNGSNSNLDIYGNKISIHGGAAGSSIYGIASNMGAAGTSNVVNIYNNRIENCTYATATTGQLYGIQQQNSGVVTVNIYNNIVRNSSTPGTGNITGIDAGNPINLSLHDNQVYGLTKTGAANIYCIRTGNSVVTAYNNTVYNISITTGALAIYGMYNGGTPSSENYYGNNLFAFTHQGSGAVYGINCNTSATSRLVHDNSVSELYSEDGTVYGIYQAGCPTEVYKNSIYNLTTNSTLSTKNVYGIQLSSGNRSRIYNNFISDLKGPQSSAVNALIGLYITNSLTTDTVGLYYNTIYLNTGSSGATFGTSGIYTSTTPKVDLRNNIVINTSIANGTAFTSAYYRSNLTLISYLATSNNNCFYAGTPSSKNVIYTDGTNSDMTVEAFKTRVSPRDNVSFSEFAPFVNSLTAPYNLHLSALVPNRCESGGTRITSPIAITNDIDGEIRWNEAGYSGTGTATDVGADEGQYLRLLNDLAIISINEPLAQTCYDDHETISVTIKNQAVNDLDFSVNPVTLTAKAFDGVTTQTFNTTLNTGILKSDSSRNLTITATLDMVDHGTYVISVYHGWATDQIHSNDTSRITRISNNPSISDITATDTIICKWSPTQLGTIANAYGGGLSTINLSRDTVASIPDPGTYYSNINVSGAGGLASEIVSVTIDSLMHTYDGDIDLYLIAPNGSTIELSTDNGGAGSNYLQTKFSMSAATPVTTGAAPFTGLFLPEGNFADLSGNANGIWKLKITDDNALNSGIFYKWTLTLKAPNTITAYSWSPATGLSNPAISNPVASPVVTTTYHLIVTDQNGCNSLADSIKIYVNPSYRDTVVSEICANDSLFVGGAWQHITGFYADNTPTLLGCDSIKVTNLIVHSVYNDTLNVVICLGDSVHAAGAWQHTSGLYFDHFYTSYLGCDSLVYTDLTVNQSYHDTRVLNLCQGDSVWAGGDYQHATGFFVDSYFTVLGCDSITYTNLTVHPLPVVSLGHDTTICWSSSITLNAGNTGATYLWSTGDTTQLNLIDSSDFWLGTHTIWVVVDDGCINTDTIKVSLDPCTGIADYNAIKLSVYPNPSGGIFNISYEAELSDCRIELLSTEGKLLLSESLNNLPGRGGLRQLNMIGYTPGIYFIRISNGGSVKTLPIIKE